MQVTEIVVIQVMEKIDRFNSLRSSRVEAVFQEGRLHQAFLEVQALIHHLFLAEELLRAHFSLEVYQAKVQARGQLQVYLHS
jgi:hypothetical protein